MITEKVLQAPQNDFYIAKSNFEEVLPIWRDHLWPGRKTKIEAYSCMKYFGGYNTDYKTREINFWAAKSGDKIIGVISGFITEPQEYRFRGVYVFPEARGKGVASALVEHVIQDAKDKNCKKLWILPRKDSWKLYERYGFVAESDWFNFSVEFGPNCFAILDLKT